MKGHRHTIQCYAYNATGPLAYTPCRADGLDHNLKNLKEVDFHHGCKGITLMCKLKCDCYVCRSAQKMPTKNKKPKKFALEVGDTIVLYRDLPLRGPFDIKKRYTVGNWDVVNINPKSVVLQNRTTYERRAIRFK